jgi:hypothetical protein
VGTESAAHSDELPPHVHAVPHDAGVVLDVDATHEPVFSLLPHQPKDEKPRHAEHDVALEPVGPPPPPPPPVGVVTHATDGSFVELAHAERRPDTGEHAVGPESAAVMPTNPPALKKTPHAPGETSVESEGSKHAGSDASQSATLTVGVLHTEFART